MANCMVNPYTGKAILANGRTAKKNPCGQIW